MTYARLALWRALDAVDEPLAYHDPNRRGFTSILVLGEARKQHSFGLENLPKWLERVRRLGGNIYIAQNEFFKPNRRLVNCSRLTSCYVDLDTYSIPKLSGLGPEALLDALLALCAEISLPEPTQVVYSGRGLQAKWVLSAPLPSRAVPRWKAVQQALCTQLAPLGADPKALDVSRVLRLVGSVNSRSGAIVRLVHRATVPTFGASKDQNGLIVHDFEVLAQTVLPVERVELSRQRDERQQRGKSASSLLRPPRPNDRKTHTESVRRSFDPNWVGNPGARRLNAYQLGWDRLWDLRKLARMRGWEQGVPQGHRNDFVFLGACFLAQSRTARAFSLEIRELAAQFAPDWSGTELTACISSVRTRVEMAAAGEMIEYKGQKVDPRYRFTNAWLVEYLRIESAEMACMRTIVDADESRRRDAARKAQKRREAGDLTREEYLARGAARADEARRLRQQGLSYATIARQLGISKSTVTGYCRLT